MKLLDILKNKFPDSSMTTLRQWIREGRVVVNQAVASYANQEVAETDQIELKGRAHRKKNLDGLTVLYEDQDVIVIDKPAGVLSVATNAGTGRSAHGILKRYFKGKGFVWPVHRLDRGTSGVLVFALNVKARDGLKDQFAAHSVDREYQAIVEGVLEEKKGRWESDLAEDSQYMMHVVPDGEGKRAITHYEVTRVSRGKSYLKVRLETGRKNQIRVHCSNAGHPIVGDQKYGALERGKLRLAAVKLGFTHPCTQKYLKFETTV